MSGLDSVQKIFDISAGIGLPGSLLWAWRDRTKNRAAGRVAEGTVRSEISSRDTAALDAHVAYVERAFETERKSMTREIQRLQGEVNELRDEISALRAERDDLRTKVAHLTEQMQELSARLDHPPEGHRS